MAFTFLNGKTTGQTKKTSPKKKSAFTFLSEGSQVAPTTELKTPNIQNRTLPSFLGGGTYKVDLNNPSRLIQTERSNYGGVATKPGYERADVFPVSLGGINASSTNIVHEKFLPEVAAMQARGEALPVIKTATDKYLIEETNQPLVPLFR